MRVVFTAHFTRSFQEAPEKIQRAFGKQLGHLLRNLRHPSLAAKKFDKTRWQASRWQARVNGGWRFYFRFEGDAYIFLDIIPHPK